jgi:uncharacterized repeat protein (TIGR01451 family)
MRTRNFIARAAGALILAGLFGTGIAEASAITVNKQFVPNAVTLGGSSVVTVTLQNSNTTTPATITKFQDNLDSTELVAGTPPALVVIDTSFVPTSSCGTPTITGADNNTITMNAGVIPMAPSSTTPGTCTIVFHVFGNHQGAGTNEIHGDDDLPSDVVTSLGDPANSIFQQLLVSGVNATVTATGAISTLASTVAPANQGTLVFTVHNPSVGVALTNASWTVTGTSTLPFTVVSAVNSCGGTTTVTGTSPTTISTTGATVPAGPGTCTVTIVTSGDGTTPSVVNYASASSSLNDDQGVTNSAGTSTQNNFIAGTPTVTKSFNPTNVLPGGTTTLTINIRNPLTTQPLDSAQIIDPISTANMTLPATPTATGNSVGACGTITPTITGGGTGTATISGLTIGANQTCTITTHVIVPNSPGGVTNTISAAFNAGVNGFSSTEINGQAANATANLTVTGTGGNISAAKSFNPTSVGPNTGSQVTLTFTNLAGATGFTAGQFTDNLPQTPEPMSVLVDGTHPTSLSAGCGVGSTFAPHTGDTSVVVTGLLVPASTVSPPTCVVQFFVQFTNTTNGTNQTDTNTLSGLSFTGTAGAVVPTAPSANLTELPSVTLTNWVASATGLAGEPVTVQASINDTTGTPDTGLVATFNLVPGKVKLAPSPNYVFGPGCPAGLTAANITPGPGPQVEFFTVNVGNISATCTISYDVINETGFTGSSGVPTNPTYYSGTTGGITHPVSFTATNNVNFQSTTVNVTKIFTPNQIQAGSTSTVQINLTVNNVSGFAQTQANGVTFPDLLPTNVTFAAVPNVTFSAGCQQIGQPAPGSSISGSTITFSNISLFSTSSTATPCIASVNVTSSVLGAPINHILANSITGTTPGLTNPLAAAATLTVAAGVAIQKTYVNPVMPIGGTDYIRFLLTNSATPSVLTGGAVIDNMPATLTLASTALGPQIAGDPALCGGNITAGTVGGSNFTLGSLTLPGTTGGGTVPGQCVAYVLIGASATAAPGPTSNTIGVGQLNIGGFSNQTSSTGSNTLGPAPGVTITKAFNSNAIAPGGTSVMTITIVNNAAGAAPLSGMSFSDGPIPNVTVAPVPAASTTCGAGTVTAVAGGTTISLANGSVAAGASCTVSVTMTSSTTGIWTNTIPAGALTSTQGASNPAPAQALLNVGATSGVGLTKSFLQTVIAPGATSLLTITLLNNATTATALTNVGLIDTMPTNVTVATPPNAATTCGVGATASATAGGSTITLAGGSMAINATCTVTVNVTGTVPGMYTNTIPAGPAGAGSITSTQGATNGSPASASLIIGQPTLVVTKTSVPSAATVSNGQTIAYTVSVRNNGTQPETNAHISDTLALATLTPGTVTVNGVAAPDNIVTGSQPFGTLAVGGTATITYSATVSATAPVGSLVTNTATAGGDQPCSSGTCSGTSPANTIAPPVLTVGKLIDNQTSESVVSGQTIVYGISIANTGAGPSVGTTMTDFVPAGLTVVPNSVTINSLPSTTANLTGQTLIVPVGTVPPASTTLITFKAVVGPTSGNVANTVRVGAAGLAQSVISNAALAHQVPAAIAVTKTTTSTTVSTGDRVNYTITATPVGGIGYGLTTIVDTLPDYEVYGPGTARVNGKAQEPSVTGHVLTWTVPTLTAPVTVTYSIAIAPGTEANTTLTNLANVTALAPGGAGFGRGAASASVLVVGSTFGSCYPITGRVYLDVNGSGHFQDPDVGLHSVKIFLDNGESVVTDSTGRYDYPCVHPGMHALRLDATTLPSGVIPYDDRNIDSEKSTRRLVHHIYDTMIIEDINFAVTGTPDQPIQPGGSGSKPK